MGRNLQITLKILRQVGFVQLALYTLYKLGLKTGYYKIVDSRKAESSQPLSNNLLPLIDRAHLQGILGQAGQLNLLSEADEIVAGKIRLFGGEPIKLKLSFDEPLQHWADYETKPALLSTLISPISDIKFIWEPARFGWAYTLGRAYQLTQTESYAESFWNYFEEFTNTNPAFHGPHWMNGQEVAIRMLAFVWASHVFESAAASSPERRAQLATSVATHAARIPPTLIYARAQNNNHLITEAAALYTVGRAFGNSKWQDLGWRWLNWAFQHQISDTGEYIQHSSNYQRLMLQTALWVNTIKDEDWPPLTLKSLKLATNWLISILDPASGRTPNLGANDGALILPLSGSPFNDFRPTAQAAARAFLGSMIPAGVWDELSLWLGQGLHENTDKSKIELSSQLRGRDSWAYLRASTFGSRLGHMDQLHLDLWWRGINVAQDAGTYLYNADPPWDNSLVTSRVHNTIMVDDQAQMTRGGRFITLDWFPAYSKAVTTDPDEKIVGQLIGYHTGYRGVRHERKVSFYADERWVVEDKLYSKKSHTYRLHWLLPDLEWDVENSEKRLVISLRSLHGRVVLVLQAEPQLPNLNSLLSLVRAGELIFGHRDVQPFEGWVSPTYGHKVPALSLVVEIQNVSNTTLISEFIFPS
ncbi:MAG: alginate lyase family protein [Anaerolineae bacterium]|nr:alginate lyase family protein [Anaerolineae bacterium]